MDTYWNEIQKSNLQANKYLETMQNQALSFDDFSWNLRKYLLAKYMLDPETKESNIYRLAVLSIQSQARMAGQINQAAVDVRMSKYDCHQTNSAVQKKVLFMMNIEKQLGIHVPNNEASMADTIEELAYSLYSLIKAYRKEH